MQTANTKAPFESRKILRIRNPEAVQLPISLDSAADSTIWIFGFSKSRKLERDSF